MLKVFALFLISASGATVDPPTDAEVIRTLPPAIRIVPGVYEQFRDDIIIVKNWAGGATIGPPRFIPLIGPVRLVLTNWECAVHYIEVFRLEFPFRVEAKQNRVHNVAIESARFVPGLGENEK